MPRFLAFAYACEPDKGSEPGAGWIWSRMLARIGETWVITRENNRPSIEAALPSTPERDNLRFVYVDLPERARFWKRGMRGARLYYVLWQAAALSRARRLLRESEFDAVWHLTWANAWIGSMAALLPRPFIYGPVGGGVSMPWRLAPALGVKGVLFEVARSIARTGARYANPLARLSWRRARLILTQNPETKVWLPRRHRSKAIVFPHVVLDRLGTTPLHQLQRPPYTALFAGRLLPWKGAALALRALIRLPSWHLIVCGDGPDAGRLKRLARRFGVDDQVEFRGMISREEVQTSMQKTDLFLFPSLHDEGGFVVAESLAAGIPVICLDRGGPPVLGGHGVPLSSVSATVSALVAAISNASGTPVPPFPAMSPRTEELKSLLGAEFPAWGLSSAVDESISIEPGHER